MEQLPNGTALLVLAGYFTFALLRTPRRLSTVHRAGRVPLPIRCPRRGLVSFANGACTLRDTQARKEGAGTLSPWCARSRQLARQTPPARTHNQGLVPSQTHTLAHLAVGTRGCAQVCSNGAPCCAPVSRVWLSSSLLCAKAPTPRLRVHRVVRAVAPTPPVQQRPPSSAGWRPQPERCRRKARAIDGVSAEPRGSVNPPNKAAARSFLHPRTRWSRAWTPSPRPYVSYQRHCAPRPCRRWVQCLVRAAMLLPHMHAHTPCTDPCTRAVR